MAKQQEFSSMIKLRNYSEFTATKFYHFFRVELPEYTESEKTYMKNKQTPPSPQNTKANHPPILRKLRVFYKILAVH
jgi:hypothetical protein